jgi:Tol biopolymer transport system component
MTIARRLRLGAVLGLLLMQAACSGADDTPSSSGLHYLEVGSEGLAEVEDGRRRLLVSVNEGMYVNGVAVSPDNKRLAFVLQPPASVKANGDIDFGTDLYVSNRDGKARREVLRHGSNGEFFSAPSFSADGQELLYVVRGRDPSGLPDFRLESLDLRSGKRSRLVDHAVDFSLAPGGRAVAYVEFNPDSTEGERLLLTEIGSHAQPKVLVPTESGLLLMGSPSFSPDGTVIAFAASSGLAQSPRPGPGRAAAGVHPTLQDLWLVNRDGSNLRMLAEIVESQPSVDWSADGKTVYAMGGSAFWRVNVASNILDRIGAGSPGATIRVLRRNIS